MRHDPDPDALATRPAPLADAPAPVAPRSVPAGDERAVFDVCHAGVALRALLAVEALPMVGALFVADDWSGWSQRVAFGSAVALPAVLLWLGFACSARRLLARLGGAGQGLVAAALGAACGALPWLVIRSAGQGLIELGPIAGPVVAGAAIGALMTVWLRLRHRALAPAEAHARLAELQSRIRPHFLFNTLNSALGLVGRDPPRTEALLEDLAELFRAALADDAIVVTLDDEIDLARRYLAIEQVRFGDRLQVVWQLDPDAGAARLPPLLLQPLVENAVRHGIEPAAEGGVVRIRTRRQRGEVQLSIANSLPGSSSKESTPGHGIALQNVRERLLLMHDVAARFDARVDGDVYRVEIVLPLASS